MFAYWEHMLLLFSPGNIKKCTSILQKAFEMNAKPRHVLEAAVQNLNVGKRQLLSHEDKENISGLCRHDAFESILEHACSCI